MIKHQDIAAVILAGGKAARMNHTDKALMKLGNRELISYVIDRVSREVDNIVLSVNRNFHKYEQFNLPLIEDCSKQFAGPLLGVHSAMNWIMNNAKEPALSQVEYLACFPGDVPIFPNNIICKLAEALKANHSSLAMVQTGSQLQPLFSLWRVDTFAQIDTAIKTGIYGPKLFAQQLDNVVVNIELNSSSDFFNINTLDDLSRAKSMMSAGLEKS
jgi:molybdopterin-guanine dinucleotide biosynthesis protein A